MAQFETLSKSGFPQNYHVWSFAGNHAAWMLSRVFVSLPIGVPHGLDGSYVGDASSGHQHPLYFFTVLVGLATLAGDAFFRLMGTFFSPGVRESSVST